MKPINFQDQNTLIKGTVDGDIGDLAAKIVGVTQTGEEVDIDDPETIVLDVMTMWKPTEEELNRLKAGAAVQVHVFMQPGTRFRPMSVTASAIFSEDMLN